MSKLKKMTFDMYEEQTANAIMMKTLWYDRNEEYLGYAKALLSYVIDGEDGRRALRNFISNMDEGTNMSDDAYIIYQLLKILRGDDRISGNNMCSVDAVCMYFRETERKREEG